MEKTIQTMGKTIKEQSVQEEETLTFSRRDLQKVAGILSDMQEFADKKTRGKLNIVKGFLFGDLKIIDRGIFFAFESTSPNSRFCDQCGLLKVGDYKECNCNDN